MGVFVHLEHAAGPLWLPGELVRYILGMVRRIDLGGRNQLEGLAAQPLGHS